MSGNRKSKVIWGIAIGAAAIIIVAISIAVLDPRRLDPIPMVPKMLVQEHSDSELPLQDVNLFFFDVESLRLVREKRELPLSPELPERLKQIIRALISGSDYGLQSTVPVSTFLHEAFVDAQSTAYLDFSRHLAEAHIGGTTAEMITIKSILQTVYANFPKKIQSVQILVEGQEVNTIAGHIDISHPFTSEFQVSAEQRTSDSP